MRVDLKDDTNNKVVGTFKDEMHGLVITELHALSPKVYSVNHQTVDQEVHKSSTRVVSRH